MKSRTMNRKRIHRYKYAVNIFSIFRLLFLELSIDTFKVQ